MAWFRRSADRHKPGTRMQEQLPVAVHRVAPSGVLYASTLEKYTMTSQNQPDPPTRGNHNLPKETQQFAGRSPRSRITIRRLWVGLSVIALVGLSAGLIIFATGGTKQAASSGSSGSNGTAVGTASSTGGTTGRSGTSVAKGKVISAAKLAEKGGALSLPKSMQSHVASWQSGSGGRELTAVSSQFGSALQAAGIKQYSLMRHACTQLTGSVAAAQAGPQIPNTAMQKLYAKALTELAKGATDCRTAISLSASGDETVQAHVNSTMLHQATSELSAGATDVYRSTAEIAIVSRQHH
jgi:hypothetical protein